MNCNEYLDRLATASVTELAQSRGHAAECADCARVTNIVLEREHMMMLAVGGYTSPLSPAEITEAAIATARRRKVGTFYTIALGAVLAATTATLVVMPLRPREATSGAIRTETFTTQCLSPEAAGEIISPYVREHGSMYYASRLPSRVLTVRTTDKELQRVRSMLDRFDNTRASKCSLP